MIAAYNASATIGQALESVLAQTRGDYEVIIVDDGSSDTTVSRVQPYCAEPRFRLYRQRNSGPGQARNAGIALASGRYVSLLDSDDFWLPSYLEHMVAALERAPQAGLAFTRAWVLERATNRIRKRAYSGRVPRVMPTDPLELLMALVSVNFVFNSVTIRRDVLERVGSYDPELIQAEDYELWLRIVGAGHGLAYVPGPLAVCSERPDSLSKDSRGALIGLREAFAKLLDGGPLAPEVVVLIHRRLADVDRQLELLNGRRSTPARLQTRRWLARVTRGWRQRRARRSTPPPEIAAAFPGVGRGIRARSLDTRQADLSA